MKIQTKKTNHRVGSSARNLVKIIFLMFQGELQRKQIYRNQKKKTRFFRRRGKKMLRLPVSIFFICGAILLMGGMYEHFNPSFSLPSHIESKLVQLSQGFKTDGYSSPVSQDDFLDKLSDSDTLTVRVNENRPDFSKELLRKGKKNFIKLQDLDSLGRTQAVVCSISKSSMPKEGEQRGEIGSVKPSGWHTVKYPGVIEGNYLYNRCHLAAWCLTGMNAEPRNLITGTRAMNAYPHSMLDIETRVAKFLDKHSSWHVLYRVTPCYRGKELLCRGVQIEAMCVENPQKLSINKFVYNKQEGIKIDYATGESSISE